MKAKQVRRLCKTQNSHIIKKMETRTNRYSIPHQWWFLIPPKRVASLYQIDHQHQNCSETKQLTVRANHGYHPDGNGHVGLCHNQGQICAWVHALVWVMTCNDEDQGTNQQQGSLLKWECFVYVNDVKNIDSFSNLQIVWQNRYRKSVGVCLPRWDHWPGSTKLC